MKRFLNLLLSICLLWNLCACEQTTEPQLPAEEPLSPVETPAPPEENLTSAPDSAYWQKYLPKMDGSTSLIPLEAGIRSALLGISMEEATEQVVHSSTHTSFNNLMSDAVDLIFSVPLSEQQLKNAKGLGVEIEQIPVAKEGFVFVVNADNPVDSLTQQQLRDIYSGNITNWSEVGGKDEPIIAYQRNRDSGSQNFMTAFMGDIPLIDAPTEQRPATMVGLMDVIAVNDHAEQSIGYSVYAYAADMYGSGDEIKFIAVDGVAPSKATMASGDYPLLSENYAIFRSDEAEDSPVRRLVDWMVSDEGQLALAKAGYVTLRDIGFEYSEAEAPAPYRGFGSGYSDTWEVPLWVSKAVEPAKEEWDTPSVLPLNVTLPENLTQHNDYSRIAKLNTGIIYQLNCLTNKELENKVNTFLAEAVGRADDRAEELYQFILDLNSDYDWNAYSTCYDYTLTNTSGIYPSAMVTVKAQNGYLWATVAQTYAYNAQDGYEKHYRTECKTWDLFSGEELTAEDLFLNGMDVTAWLNNFVRIRSQSPIDSWGTLPRLSEDFTRLPLSGWTISPEAFYVDTGKLGFEEGLKFSLEKEAGVLCTQLYRNMSACFDESKVDLLTELAVSPYEPVYTYVNDNFFDVKLLDETVGNTKARKAINEDFLQRISGITKENAIAYFEAQGVKVNADEMYSWYSWDMQEFGDEFVAFTAPDYLYYDYERNMDCSWDKSGGLFLYDLQSGEQILRWYDLLCDDWQKDCKVTCHNQNGSNFMFDGDFSIFQTARSFYILQGAVYRDHPIGFSFIDSDGNSYDLELPLSALKCYRKLPK